MNVRKLMALGALVALLTVGCELEKDPSTAPPPQPQPPADLTSSDPANPTPDRLIFSSGKDEPDLELYTSFADGSGRVRLTRNLEGESGAVHYPDTGLVYYVCGRSESVCVATTAGTGTAGVMTSQQQGFAIIEDPDISPDGSKMLWTAVKISSDGSSTNYDIYMYDFATETNTKFAVGAAQDQMPTWVSNDQVVWSRFRSGDWDLVTFRIGSPAGSSPTVLTDNDLDDLGVDASNDGSKLSWIGTALNDRNAGQLFTMPFSAGGGQTATKLTDVRLERGFIGGDPDTAWSPDGTRIAYAGIPSGEDDVEIFTISASGGTPTNVTKNSVYDVDPDWALIPPTVSVGSPLVKTEGSSGPVVFEIRLDAPQSQTVTVQYTTEPGTATTADFTPVSGTATFSPGETVERVSVTVKNDTILEPMESFTLRIFNTSAGTLVGTDEAKAQIRDDEIEPTPTRTAAPTPTVSPTTGPTSQVIAYEASTSIWLVDPNGTNPRQVQASGSSPDIHPDGTKIAFGYPPGSSPDIYTAPINGGTRTIVPGSTQHYDNSPQWSTDGSGLLWTTVNGPSFNTYVADPITDTTPVIFPEGIYYADWGRVDGSEVIVAVDQANGMIGLYNPATGSRIGDPIVEGIAPEISPDGTKLAYASDMHGDMDIFVLDLTDPNATGVHMMISPATDSNPAWSPDSQWIAFSTNRTGSDDDIYKIRWNMPNSEVAVVATDAHETWPSWGVVAGGTSRMLQETPVPTVPSEQPSPAPSGSMLVVVPLGVLLASAAKRRRG